MTSPEQRGCLVSDFDLDVDYLASERGCLAPECEKGMTLDSEGMEDDGE